PVRGPAESDSGLAAPGIATEPGGRSGGGPAGRGHRFAGRVRRARLAAGRADWRKGARLIAWAGIGAPERFFALLEQHGAKLAARVAFRDHQRLSEADALRLLELARRQSAGLITTAKDRARLLGERGVLAQLAGASKTLV